MTEADEVVFETLWKRVLDDFGDEEAHEKLLGHGQKSGRLPELAKRYRGHKDGLPPADVEGRAAADRRLSAIAQVAMAELEHKRPEAPRRHPLATAFMVMLGLLFVAAVASLIRALLL